MVVDNIMQTVSAQFDSASGGMFPAGAAPGKFGVSGVFVGICTAKDVALA